MGEVIEVGKITACAICHKREAKYLCDMPKSRGKTLHLKKENGVTDHENSFKWNTYTCDLPICEKCAIEVGDDVHFCKRCAEKLKPII